MNALRFMAIGLAIFGFTAGSAIAGNHGNAAKKEVQDSAAQATDELKKDSAALESEIKKAEEGATEKWDAAKGNAKKKLPKQGE